MKRLAFVRCSRVLVAAALLAGGCSGAPMGTASDLAQSPGADLTPPPGSDLTTAPAHDLAVAPADMAVAVTPPDLATPDLQVAAVTPPDLAMPDLQVAVVVHDMTMSDLAVSDLAVSDLAVSDLAVSMPDLTPLTPPDLTPPIDLAAVQVGDVVNQLAGVMVGTLAGSAQPGAHDDTGGLAQFENPVGIAIDGSGLLYVTEYDGNRIRTVDSGGTTHTLTASGGTYTFTCPFAVTVASSTQLVVQTDCDPSGGKNASSGTLWRVDLASGAPTPAVQGLARPRGLAYVDANTVAVSDHVLETVSTWATAGSTLTLLAGSSGNAGFVDDTGAAARFDDPIGLAALPDGSLAVADTANNRIRQISAAGVVTTFSGGGQYGNVDGPRSDARFNAPRAVAVDSAGDVFVSDNGDHRIRRIASDGTVATVAGDGSAGFQDGSGASAEFYGQEGLAVTPDGKTLYVADGNNGDGSGFHRIRFITIP